jgi:uncharacterized tellurite resistance protein B-like protein
MLKKLSTLFDRAFAAGESADEPDRQHGLRVATALLLIEVARADYRDDYAEDSKIFELMKDFFELSDADTELLLEDARREADHAVELQRFTRRLHEQLTGEEKGRVIEMLWKVALADRRLDKHEDHLVRKVADLLYVPHSELIRIRNRVRTSEA